MSEQVTTAPGSATHHALSHYWVKVLVWLIPVVFGAGGIYTSVARSQDDIDMIKKDLVATKAEVADHTKAGVGHLGTKTRLKQIEKGQEKIITRQQIQSENIAAICQATKANCK